MKNITKIFVVLAFAWLAVGCQQDDIKVETTDNATSAEVGVFGDEMRISLNVVAPDPIEVTTRAVDPDGKTMQSLYLFCFDANGLFLTTSTAQIQSTVEDKLEGTFSASIPKTTRIIHLVANQNMTLFNKDKYVYKTEDDVLSALEGSAGMLIYWARIEAPENINGLYTEALYKNSDGDNVPASQVNRTDAEAFVDWLTIETNPTDKTHRGVKGMGNPIIMLRNQAKFTIISEGEGSDKDDDWKGDSFEVTGFVVCNTPAFGTVAPYHTDFGFPTYACSTFTPEFGVAGSEQGISAHSTYNWLDEGRVTLAARRDKMSDIVDVTNAREQHVFETNNIGTDPVDLILRGRNRNADGTLEAERYYYRVNILDEEAELINILRNHHYEIHITGNLNNGCLTFDEALVAPPTNNIWLSISDEVNSVRNNDFVLTVAKTKEIVETDAVTGQPEMSELKLKFNVKALEKKDANGNPYKKEVERGKISVYWVEDDQKVSSTFNPSLVIGNKVSYDDTSGDGVITLAMNKLASGSEYERGSIVVKYGHLMRRIRIILMRTKEFTPTWVSSEVYGTVTGEENEDRSNVTIVFTIPKTCPEELFPIDVLVTTNGLDGRAATGQILPIVREGEDGYRGPFSIEAPDRTTVTDIGYKYKYTVYEPGQHRLYFENIFNVTDGQKAYVILEAENFEYMPKLVTYVEHQNSIVLPNLMSYSHIAGIGGTESEVVKYILVPQKRFAPVVFDIRLEQGVDEQGVNIPYTRITNEEFLLYSSNLDHYTDDETRIPETSAGINSFTPYNFSREDFDCYFRPYSHDMWLTGGRIYGFWPRENKIISPEEPFLPLDDDNCFQIFMETNKPNSEEVVRVASNQRQSASVINNHFLYGGKTFRSTTFELANYRPFRFAAQIKAGNADYVGNYVGDDATSGTQNPEVVDNIEFEYLPDETIAISFDVTSFHTGTGENMISIDPFGHAFEIFIDAPMLKMERGLNKVKGYTNTGKNFEDVQVKMFDKDANGNGYTTMEPKLEDVGNGRFVYRVNAMNYDEYSYWGNDVPLIKDEYYKWEQNGERKTIYFKKNSITSKGEITISANPEHVTYHSKTFKVSNKPIEGRIGYLPVDENGVEANEPTKVPAGQFVSFVRVYDESRIGSLNVISSDEGAPDAMTYYQLRLRGEYEFSWENDPIKIQTQIDGKYYSTQIPDLKTLYNNRHIILTLDEE